MSNQVEEMQKITQIPIASSEHENKKRQALEVLAHLRKTYETLPVIDAEALIREGRENAGRRFQN